MASDSASLDQIPTVPLRDMVVFPQAVQPLFVGTETSINALDSAMAADKKVLLVDLLLKLVCFSLFTITHFFLNGFYLFV